VATASPPPPRELALANSTARSNPPVVRQGGAVTCAGAPTRLAAGLLVLLAGEVAAAWVAAGVAKKSADDMVAARLATRHLAQFADDRGAARAAAGLSIS